MVRNKNAGADTDGHDQNEGDGAAYFSILVLWAAVLLIVAVFGALAVHYFFGVDIPWVKLKNYSSAQYWGQLGDFAGGLLNPILSFFALMAVLKTMSFQRSEMRAAQQEARAANLEQKLQSKLYSKQAFEATFFGLLEIHAKILGDIQASSSSDSFRGREAVERFVHRFKISKEFKAAIVYPGMVEDEVVQKQIDQFCLEVKEDVGHYFRNLYWILKKIDTDGGSWEIDYAEKSKRSSRRRFYFDYVRKREYASLVRAQLSDYEMALLQINCLGPYGGGLKHYVEKYSLLKPLGKDYFGPWSEYISGKFNELAFKSLDEIHVNDLTALQASSDVFRWIRAKAKAGVGDQGE